MTAEAGVAGEDPFNYFCTDVDAFSNLIYHGSPTRMPAWQRSKNTPRKILADVSVFSKTPIVNASLEASWNNEKRKSVREKLEPLSRH